MSKKSFKTSFDDLLGHGKAESVESKTKHKYQETKSTFVIRCDHLDKIKAIVKRQLYWSTLASIKMVHLH